MTATELRFLSAVRQPSHIEPPFGAQQFWNDNGCVQTFTGAPVRFQTNWGGQGIFTTGPRNQGPQVPVGMRAELVWMAYTVLTFTAPVLIPCSLVLTVVKNGNPVPGYFNMKPAFNLSSDGGSVGTVFREMTAASPRVCAPIHFSEGDRLDLEIVEIGAGEISYFYDLRWCGWLYPVTVEGEAGTIRQTLQDPGVVSPLQDPTQALRRQRR